jgi:hypothetical protein
MIGEKQRRFVESVGVKVSPRIQAAIVLLAEAHDYARQARCNLWDFAVESGELKARGLLYGDFCWLITNGYARCALEVTKQEDPTRKFHPVEDMSFSKKTCFIATNAGLRLTTVEPVNLQPCRRAA